MSEIKNPPIEIAPGQTWTNHADAEAIVFTASNTHRDILRYVIAELGDETLFHVQDVLGGRA